MAKPITAALLVRSGRFETTTASLKIIAAFGVPRIYRFHNTKLAGAVTVSLSNGDSVAVGVGKSFDLLIPKDVDVSVGPNSRGVYDLLNGGAVRSGSIDGGGTIAKLDANKEILYRVINASESHAFDVNSDGNAFTVGPQSSIDMPFKGEVQVVKTSGSGTLDPAGVFDMVGDV